MGDYQGQQLQCQQAIKTCSLTVSNTYTRFSHTASQFSGTPRSVKHLHRREREDCNTGKQQPTKLALHLQHHTAHWTRREREGSSTDTSAGGVKVSTHTEVATTLSTPSQSCARAKCVQCEGVLMCPPPGAIPCGEWERWLEGEGRHPDPKWCQPGACDATYI